MERPYHFGAYAAIALIAGSERLRLKNRLSFRQAAFRRGYAHGGALGQNRGRMAEAYAKQAIQNG